MNEWKVYDKSQYENLKHAKNPDAYKVAALGDYLAIKYLAGNMNIVYVDTNGHVCTVMSHNIILLRSQNDQVHHTTIRARGDRS